MHKRKPTSSLSRRLLVGAKICERYLIGVFSPAQEDTPANGFRSMPEPYDYDKNERRVQLRIRSSIQNDKHHLCGHLGSSATHVVSFVRLLQMPHQGETDHNHTYHDPINDEDLQAVGLKVANQPGNRDISHNRGNQHPN